MALVEPAVFSAAAHNGLSANRDRDIKIAPNINAMKISWRHANDVKGMATSTAFQGQRLAQNRNRATIFLLPEAIADHRSWRRAPALIVSRRKYPSNERRHFESLEKIAARPHHLAHANFASARQVQALSAEGSDRAESLLLVPNLLPHWVRHPGIRPVEASRPPVTIGDAHKSQRLRIFHRQGAQPHRIDELKDCRIRADAQGQRKNRNCRKCFINAQQARAIANILPNGFWPSVHCVTPEL